MHWALLGYTVAIACASPRNSIWFTRSFLLVKGWGLGRRLGKRHIVQRKKTTFFFCYCWESWDLARIRIGFFWMSTSISLGLQQDYFVMSASILTMLQLSYYARGRKGLVTLGRFLCARGEQRYVYGSSILCSIARASAAQLVRASDPYSEDPGFVFWLDLNVTFSMKIITEV